MAETTMDKVNKIKADIAALPAEYRSLVQAEQAWVAKHPVWYGVILLGVGLVVGLVAPHL